MGLKGFELFSLAGLLSPSTSSAKGLGTPVCSFSSKSVVKDVGIGSAVAGGSGRLLLTRIPMTWPKALTPRSVRPHLEYSHPAQFRPPSSIAGSGVGKINFALFSAFHSFSSTVGNGVSLPV